MRIVDTSVLLPAVSPSLPQELLRGAGAGGDLTTDAWIAAIALAHGASVLMLDSDFARFPGLRWENPLGG